MATIGLDNLVIADIIEDANGEETYGTPEKLAKAIQANISVELLEAILYADDAASEVVKKFKQGGLSLNVDDLGKAMASRLLGATVDTNGVLISTAEDVAKPVAVGFRALKANGKYRYFWLYRVVFGIPANNTQTKGDSITFNTPTIEGTIMARNRADSNGKHPWKTEVTVGEGTITETSSVIANWFTSVYEANGQQEADTALSSLNITKCSLEAFNPNVLVYHGTTTDTSGTITFATRDSNATAKAYLNGTTSKDSGGTIGFTAGEDTTIHVIVMNGSASRTYTVIISKPATN